MIIFFDKKRWIEHSEWQGLIPFYPNFDILQNFGFDFPEAVTGGALEEKVFLEIWKIHRKTSVPDSPF